MKSYLYYFRRIVLVLNEELSALLQKYDLVLNEELSALLNMF